ncbi:MAG: hypothetical protein ABR559_01215 [Gemmatimonadota bacterium]
MTVTANVSEAQEPRPGAAAGVRSAEIPSSPDFQQIGREFHTLAWDVENLLGKLAGDRALRRRLEAAAISKDYRAVEEVLRAAGVPEQNAITVQPASPPATITITICLGKICVTIVL